MKHISIPNPCSENWDEMTPTEKGAFCQKCSKDVYDFTRTSFQEIREIVEQNENGSICGRIRKAQLVALQDEYSQWYEPNSTSVLRLFLFSLFLVFGLGLFTCSAQESEMLYRVQFTGQRMIGKSETQALPSNIPTIEPIIEDRDDEWTSGPFVWGERIFGPMIKQDVKEEELIDSIAPIQKKTEIKTPTPPTKFDVRAYPNPTRSTSTLEISVPDTTKFAIRLFSISGYQIRSYGTQTFEPGTHEFPLNLEDLPAATYIIGLQGEKLGKTVRIQKL